MKEIADLLDSIGIQVVTEGEEEITAYCPFHENSRTPALSINTTKAVFHCWNPACGESGTLLKLLQKATGMSTLSAAQLLQTYRGQESAITKVKENDELYEVWPESTLEHVAVDWNDTDLLDKYFETLYERGFDDHTLHEFEVGFSKKRQRIVVPLRDEFGKLVGFSGRAISVDQEPKYWDKGAPKKYILFNLHRAKKFSTAIVVEGPFDVMKVFQAGFENVVGTLGGGFTRHQAFKLTQYFRDAILFTDNDEAGRALANKVQEAMRRAGKQISFVKYPEGVKDPGEMTAIQIQEAIQSRETLLERKFKQLGIGEYK